MLDPEVTSLSVDCWEDGYLQVTSLTPGQPHAQKDQFISPRKHRTKKKLLEEAGSPRVQPRRSSTKAHVQPAPISPQPNARTARPARTSSPRREGRLCRCPIGARSRSPGLGRPGRARGQREGSSAPGGPQRGLGASPQRPHGGLRAPTRRDAARRSHAGTERAARSAAGPGAEAAADALPAPQRGGTASPTRRRRDAPGCLSGSSSSPTPGRQGAVPGASAPRPAGSGQAPYEDAPRPRGFLRLETAAQPGRGRAARSALRAELLRQHRAWKELPHKYAMSFRVNRGFYWLEECDVTALPYIRGARRPLGLFLR